MRERRAGRIAVAWVAFVVVALMQFDLWRPRGGRLLLGWLPEELAYRLVVLVLAWLLMMYICSRIWETSADR